MNPFRSRSKLACVLAVAVLSLGVEELAAAAITSPFVAAARATGNLPHVDSTNQFVLLDTLIRLVPAARMEEKFPGADDPLVIE